MGKRKLGIASQCPFGEFAHLFPLVRTNEKGSHLRLSFGQGHSSGGEPALVQFRGSRKHCGHESQVSDVAIELPLNIVKTPECFLKGLLLFHALLKDRKELVEAFTTLHTRSEGQKMRERPRFHVGKMGLFFIARKHVRLNER